MAEIWKNIPGFLGYQASSAGRIRSIDRLVSYAASKSGRHSYSMFRKGRILKAAPANSGHLNVVLGRKVGTKSVHVLIARTFFGNCPVGAETLHLDHDPTNNRVANLRYGTRSENLRMDWADGRRKVHPNFNRWGHRF